jgi:predicted nucleic acid-binding protein
LTSAVDTNILLDILTGNEHTAASRDALDREGTRGALVISEPVYAELSAVFPDATVLDSFLRDISIELVNSQPEVLHRAGLAWREYASRRAQGLTCGSCGTEARPKCPRCRQELRVRQHIVPDFIIGAHAERNGGSLLTRDRGFYRSYFRSLRVTSS